MGDQLLNAFLGIALVYALITAVHFFRSEPKWWRPW